MNQPSRDMEEIYEEHHNPQRQNEKRMKENRKQREKQKKEDLGL